MTGRKRFYEFEYPHNNRPVWLTDIGNQLQISGVVYQGEGLTLAILTPDTGYVSKENFVFVSPSAEVWSEILERSNDPLIFEEDESGVIKTIQRKQRASIGGFVQQKVWVRDEYKCVYCERRMGDVQLTIDHFEPLERGGSNDPTNYVTACKNCNKDKGSRLPAEWCEAKGFDWYYILDRMRKPLE